MRILFVCLPLFLAIGANAFSSVPMMRLLRPKLTAQRQDTMRLMMTAEAESAFSSTLSEERIFPPGMVRSVREKAPRVMKKLAKLVLPFVVQFAILAIFSSMPALASTAAKEAIAKSKPPPLWKKILEGANVSGSFKKWKAGDTRTEFAALLNSVSSFFILGGMFFLAFLKQKQRDFKQDSALQRELHRVTEYKENMYFEAVEDILKKLDDSKTKGSAKASLQKQLKDLDPEGVIQKFVKEGGARPDISNLINRKPKNNKTKKQAADKDKPLKKKPSSSASKDSTSTSTSSSSSSSSKQKKPPAAPTAASKYTDDDDDEGNDDGDDDLKSPPPRRPPTAASASSPTRKEDRYQEVLDALEDSLTDALSKDVRARLVSFLKGRIEKIADAEKRAVAVTKIAERLGEIDYWVAYSDKLGGP